MDVKLLENFFEICCDIKKEVIFCIMATTSTRWVIMILCLRQLTCEIRQLANAGRKLKVDEEYRNY